MLSHQPQRTHGNAREHSPRSPKTFALHWLVTAKFDIKLLSSPLCCSTILPLESPTLLSPPIGKIWLMTPSINRKQPKITDYRRYLATATATRIYPIIDIKLTVRRLSLPFNEEKTENHLPHGVRMGPFPPPNIVGVRSVGRSIPRFVNVCFVRKSGGRQPRQQQQTHSQKDIDFPWRPECCWHYLISALNPPRCRSPRLPAFPPHTWWCVPFVGPSCFAS